MSNVVYTLLGPEDVVCIHPDPRTYYGLGARGQVFPEPGELAGRFVLSLGGSRAGLSGLGEGDPGCHPSGVLTSSGHSQSSGGQRTPRRSLHRNNRYSKRYLFSAMISEMWTQDIK